MFFTRKCTDQVLKNPENPKTFNFLAFYTVLRSCVNEYQFYEKLYISDQVITVTVTRLIRP